MSRQYAVDPDKLAKSMGIPDDISKILLEGASHHAYCRCSTCRKYWSLVGPDEDGNYGPFSVEEIEREKNSA